MSTEEVRRKVHAATDAIDVPPADPVGLLERAQASGGGPSRRVLVLVAAFVVILGVAVTMVVRGAGEPDTVDDPDDYVEGSAQALAALAIERLDIEPDIPVMGVPVDTTEEEMIVANLALEGSHDELSATQLGVGAGVDTDPQIDMCDDELSGCVPITTDRGDVNLIWWDGELPPEAEGMPDGFFTGMAGVGWLDPESGDLEYAMLNDPAVTGDPRELDLRFSVDDLVDLVTDPRFGRVTTPDLAAAELPGWTTPAEEVIDDPDSAEEMDFSDFEKTDDPFVGDEIAMVESHLGIAPRRVRGWVTGDHAQVDIRLPGDRPRELFLTVMDGMPTGGFSGMGCTGIPDAGCETWEVSAGTVTLSWFDGPDGSGLLDVSLEGKGYRNVSLTYETHGQGDRDPRELDLPVTIDQLVALLSDPGVALP